VGSRGCLYAVIKRKISTQQGIDLRFPGHPVPSLVTPLAASRLHLEDCRYNFRVQHYVVGDEILTTVVMKSSIFWDITLCSPLNVNRRFGGTYRLHLQGRRISRAACHSISRLFIARLILRP
jgi:hypothetical protein